jgi:hypothetical protein
MSDRFTIEIHMKWLKININVRMLPSLLHHTATHHVARHTQRRATSSHIKSRHATSLDVMSRHMTSLTLPKSV